jgi:protein tyrosine phosphatase
MLCSTVEGGKPKCAQYYPLATNETKTHGAIVVINKQNTTPPGEKIYESILFEVSVGQEKLQTTVMRWLEWPDFGIPLSVSPSFECINQLFFQGMGMLRILKSIRDTRHTTAVIHCSAGIGRTGTMMACEICLRILLTGKELNVRIYSIPSNDWCFSGA